MDFSKVNWVIDEIIQERGYQTGFPTMADAARELGCSVYETKYIPLSVYPDNKIPIEFDDSCVVTHGTVQFCNQIEKFKGSLWNPCVYFNKNVKTYSTFAVHLGHRMLNEDYNIIPWGEFKKRCSDIYFLPAWESYFIKPNSGMKEFTGKVINARNYFEEFNSMNQIERVDEESLVVYAPTKEIMAEFRYLIVNGKVIDGSEYRWDNVLDVRIDTHPVCDAMAREVASMEWQADTVYVCDIALLRHDVAKVVELNAFSSSGMYALDTRKVVRAVSEAAWNEFEGNI